MNKKVRIAYYVTLSLLLIALVAGVFAGFFVHHMNRGDSLGIRVLRLMYEYEDVETDLISNYHQLHEILDEDCWERLSIDNEFRVISAYYKLKGDKTKVEVVKEYPNTIIYRLDNPNIDKDALWVFQYEVKNRRVCNIKEYQMARTVYGKEGVF